MPQFKILKEAFCSVSRGLASWGNSATLPWETHHRLSFFSSLFYFLIDFLAKKSANVVTFICSEIFTHTNVKLLIIFSLIFCQQEACGLSSKPRGRTTARRNSSVCFKLIRFSALLPISAPLPS